MFIGKYNKSLLITYMGVTSSIIGIYLALGGNVRYAMVCLIIAGVCDLFDGMFARMCKRTEEEKLFGIEIDTLSDIINFVSFPIVIFYSLGLNQWYHVIIFTLFALSAITRLGYFNISAKKFNADEPVKYYNGLPVTYAALIFPIAWLLLSYLNNGLFSIAYATVILLVALFFILNIKISKPRGLAYLFFALLAVAASFIIIFFGGSYGN